MNPSVFHHYEPNRMPHRAKLPTTETHLSLERVSKQARQRGCSWAANAGPFHRDGTSAGTLMIGGKIINHDFGGAIGFGITAVYNEKPEDIRPTSRFLGSEQQARQFWVIGPLQNESQARDELKLMDYVTGFDWLVYDSINMAKKKGNNKHSPPVQRAPRTAIGLDAGGNLMVLVADGCERW
mmetsp:Transcript_35093/g.73090  ORF Transcript_35093/g.73090 Transcript_35093/m.73090 type:complete len:182 (-) Transcript_35093:596-1141(-)